MIRSFVVSASALLALAACGQPAADNAAAPPANASAPTAPAGTNWVETVSKTPEGGFLIGNPNAPVKVVEYLSLTCGVCADFAANGMPALLQNYVATGRASLELRNYVRDPIDLTTALLTRCQGAAPYLQLTDQTLEAQHDTLARAQALSVEAQTRIGQLPQAEQYAALAEALELDDFYAQRGLGAQRAAACLADPAALEELIGMQRAANESEIRGTPAFFVNGEIQQVTNWRALEPLIQAALN